MKRKQRIVAIILLCTALAVMGVIQCFAETIDEMLTTPPDDLGTIINGYNSIWRGINKYYYKIDTSQITENYLITTYYLNENSNYENAFSFRIIDNGNNTITITTYQQTNNITTLITLNYTIEKGNIIYVPVYIYNGQPNYGTANNTSWLTVYYSSTTDQNILTREAYETGYQNGYNNGFDEGLLEGQNIKQYTNLVGYVEQLIGQFTGTEVAQYITPIAIVLVVLFVYFLFIRFLLSLIKAKGVIKTCDIIMIVACIIMLVVMYAPMLDLTIKTEQVNTTETTQVVEQVNRTQIRIEHTETGDIYYGPVGTAIVPIYEVAQDTITKQVNTESEQYEKG